MELSDDLYAVVLQCDFKAADDMIKAGAALDEDTKKALTEGVGKDTEDGSKKRLKRLAIRLVFDKFIEGASAEDFAAVSEKLSELVGKPLFYHYNDFHYAFFLHNYYDPLIFETILKCYNGKSMRKQATMQEIIDQNNVNLLGICAKYGWLKMPKIRDAMIDYANKQNRPECTAFLLDFKNRTADLAAERERAEKRMLREMNANPNSLAELKKVWRFTKLEDGTLEITSYKGKQTEVVVPEKIGKDTVTSIGNGAFTGNIGRAKRTPREICNFRQGKITKITLPETISNIGEGAFDHCLALTEVNIPGGVKVVRSGVFTYTAIEVLRLPETVEEIADYAFSGGKFKELILPKGLKFLGKAAFDWCTFERIEIPENISVIMQGTFWGCKKLKEVVLPEGMETIKARAFWTCPELETINLPASIKKIENYKRGGKIHNAFTDSPNLTATVERGSYAEKYCIKNHIAYRSE